MSSTPKTPDRPASGSPPNTTLEQHPAETLACLSHELRQVLGALVGALQVIRKSPDGASRERACAVAEKQCARLFRLTGDLRDTSRDPNRATSLHWERFDLRPVIEDIAESVAPQVRERSQALDVRVPSEPVWLYGDCGRMQQVVSNLLMNAVKYTNPGGRLWAIVRCEAGQVVLVVGDTGRGISREFLPHVFDMFARGDQEAEPGLGVGLAITRHLVELHGGTIRASSPGLGGGSEFVVTLRAADSIENEARTCKPGFLAPLAASHSVVRRPRSGED